MDAEPRRSNVQRFDGVGMCPPVIGSPEPYDEHPPLVQGGQGRSDQEVLDGAGAIVWLAVLGAVGLIVWLAARWPS